MHTLPTMIDGWMGTHPFSSFTNCAFFSLKKKEPAHIGGNALKYG